MLYAAAQVHRSGGEILMSSGQRVLVLRCGCNTGHFAPSTEGSVACGAALVGGQAMATELEVVVDPAVGGQETLGVAG